MTLRRRTLIGLLVLALPFVAHSAAGILELSPMTAVSHHITTAISRIAGITGVAYGTIVQGINVKDPPFGAKGDGVTDDTAAIQNAITAAAGRPIFVPPGIYVITSSLTYSTTTTDRPGLHLFGAGMFHTIFDNRVTKGTLLSINGSVTSSMFQKGGWLRDFSIVTTTSPESSHGIDLKGAWYYTLERLRISGLTGDAIRLTSAFGDPDAPSNVAIRQCEIRSNRGIGINFNSSPAVINTGGVQISGSQIVSNTGGGIQYVGLVGTLNNSSIASNGGFGGLYIKYNGGGPATLSVRNVEFDNNTESHVKIDAGASFTFEACHFQFQDISDGRGFQPTKGLIIGDGVNPLTSVRVWGARVRSTPTNPTRATTMYDIKQNANGVLILDTVWAAFSGNNAIHFSDTGVNTNIRDGGSWLLLTEGQVLQSPVYSPYTPKLLSGSFHRLRVDKSPLVIHAPTDAAAGRRIIFSIFNNTGGRLAVNFDPAYLQPAFTPPESGKRKTAMFVYDAASGAWVLVGHWSPDF